MFQFLTILVWLSCYRKDHGGGYYKCNKFEEGDDGKGAGKGGSASAAIAAERTAKKELERYLHYYERFQGHDSNVKYAATTLRALIEKKMFELQVLVLI